MGSFQVTHKLQKLPNPLSLVRLGLGLVRLPNPLNLHKPSKLVKLSKRSNLLKVQNCPPSGFSSCARVSL